jgi:hypothetical protein
MSGEERDRIFVENLGKILAEAEENTDALTRMRLQSARLRALEAAEKPFPWYVRFPKWVTAGGLATAMVIVLAISFWQTPDRPSQANGQVEDLEIMTTHEQLELYKDLDFYRWLETVDNAG